MQIERIIQNGRVIAAVSDIKGEITDAQSALDTVMTVKYEVQTDRVIFPKEAFSKEFFILSSGVAGEIIQKFINYQVKAAIYGDFTGYTSKPLKDFMYESNHGKDLFFTDTKDAAAARLADC